LDRYTIKGRTLLFALALWLLVLALTASGASPLQTQNASIGPYALLLSYYNLPRAGQELNMTIESNTPGVKVQFSQVVLNPARGTDANTVAVQLSPDKDTPDVYDVNVAPPIRGAWLLHVTIQGPSGTAVGDVPIDVQGPPVIPTWLGWLIGLLPLPLLILFIWLQVGWRKKQREQVRREILERPSF
jgi:hypothetical protein